MGSAIAEEDQVVALLGSLPQSYSTLVTAIESRGDEDLRLDAVQEAIRHEEQKMKQVTEYSPDSSSALMSNRGTGKRSHYKPRSPPICYKCQQKGHISHYCTKQPSTSDSHKAKSARANTTDNSSSDEAFISNSKLPSDQCYNANRWVIDSGATRHMTPSRDLFANYIELDQPEHVGLGDGHLLTAVGVGQIKVKMKLGNKTPHNSVLTDVLHVPGLACNLFSVRCAAENGKIVQFGHTRCWLKDSNGVVRATGTIRNKLYELDCESTTVSETAHVSLTSDSTLWHERFGHVNRQTLHKMVSAGAVVNMPLIKA